MVDDFDVLVMDPQLELSGRHVEEEVGGVGDEGRDCAFQQPCLERVRTQQVAEGGGDLRLLGRFFLLFVEALSFVEPVGGVLRGDARGRGRVGPRLG